MASFLRRAINAKRAANISPTRRAERMHRNPSTGTRSRTSERTAARPWLGSQGAVFLADPPYGSSAIRARLLTRVNRESRTPDLRRTSLPKDSFDSKGRVTLRTFRRSYRLLRWNDSYGCRDVGRRGDTGSPKPLLHVTLTLTMRATVGSRQSLTSVLNDRRKSASNALQYARIYVRVLMDVRIIAATTEYPARDSSVVRSITCALLRSEHRGKREKTWMKLSYFIVLILLTFRSFVSSLRGVTDILRELIL